MYKDVLQKTARETPEGVFWNNLCLPQWPLLCEANIPRLLFLHNKLQTLFLETKLVSNWGLLQFGGQETEQQHTVNDRIKFKYYTIT